MGRYRPRPARSDREILALGADLRALNRGTAAGSDFVQELEVKQAFGEALFEDGEGFGEAGPLPRCGGIIRLHKRFML